MNSTDIEEQQILKARLHALESEHRDLDDVIERLSEDKPFDQLKLQRMKKRKLVLKDEMALVGRFFDIIAWTRTEKPMSNNTTRPAVAVCMGSQSDWATMKEATEMLEILDVPHEAKIISASHPTGCHSRAARPMRFRGNHRRCRRCGLFPACWRRIPTFLFLACLSNRRR